MIEGADRQHPGPIEKLRRIIDIREHHLTGKGRQQRHGGPNRADGIVIIIGPIIRQQARERPEQKDRRDPDPQQCLRPKMRRTKAVPKRGQRDRQGARPEHRAMLLVEQDVAQAMRVATDVVCLLEGRAVLSGRAGALSAAQVEQAYFGRTAPAAVPPPREG